MADQILISPFRRDAGSYRAPGFHDPDSKRKVTLVLTPPAWSSATVYYKRGETDYDAVIPATFTGVYFAVVNPGKSGSTEPTFDYELGQLTEDGTTGLVWVAKAFNFLPPGITVSSVTYSATNGATVSSTSNTTTTCTFMVDAVGSTAAARTALTFDVKSHIVLSNSEEVDISVEFVIDEL